MTDEDPPRLKSAGDTSAEVARALRALGQDDRDAARLARVAERLGASVAASGASSSASWLQMLTGTKAGLAGLGLGLAALGALGYTLIANRRSPPPTEALPGSAPVVVVPPSASAPVPGTETAEPPRSTPSETLPAPGSRRPDVRRPSYQRPSTRPSIAPRVSPGSSVADPDRQQTRMTRIRNQHPTGTRANSQRSNDTRPGSRGSGDKVLRAQSPAAASATVSANEEASVDAAPTGDTNTPMEPGTQHASERVTPHAQASESALLRRAHKVASKRPKAALRLLREHAERFPSGLLAPEREVLTIEVLRRLGRMADAARRLQQFEARFPDSLHLRRLKRGQAAADDR